MRIISQTSLSGVTEELFDLDGIPGVLWTPSDAPGPRPLILLGHGGGQHKKAPGILARAEHFVAGGGFAVACIDVPNHGDRPHDADLDRRAKASAGDATLSDAIADFQAFVATRTVDEFQRTVTAVQHLDRVGRGPVGYWGVSLGGGLGFPFVAADPRVRAAVLGLAPTRRIQELAGRITIPVQFLVQWDDERVPREHSLALYDALGSTEKTMHANPGRHAELPRFEIDSALRFFLRHLSP